MRPRTLLIAALALVALVAALAREASNTRITELPAGDPSQGWFSFDPDTHYHARRVARLLEGAPGEGPLGVAERDPWLDHPHGARIPWPPYYTLLLAGALAPIAPDDPGARAELLERGVASLPWLLGTLTAALVAGVAWRLAAGVRRPREALAAALLAGTVYALLGNALHYGAPGTGDHHAWATLCATVVLALVSTGSTERALASPRAGALLGVGAGAVAGVLLGSWVGGLVHVLVAQAALGWLVLRARREELPGLPGLGLGFHLAAALVLAPAVLSSPWKDDHPWMVVNLSWFHLVHLALGALVFVPLLGARAGSPLRRAWPWAVAAGLVALGLATATLELGFARGVREGFAWAGRANEFMAYIAESQPLLWGQEGSLGELLDQLGVGALLLLPAWIVALAHLLRRRRDDLAVWVAAVPPLAWQALLQRRFADALGPVLAVLLGWALAVAVGRSRRLAGRPAWVTGALAVLLGLALSSPAVGAIVTRLAAGQHWLGGPQAATFRGERALYRWLTEHTPAVDAQAPEYGVLAAWYHGHPIEWVGRRPTVATNFGSYVGVEGYLAPWRFLLAEDPARGEALLAGRGVRYVLVGGGLTRDLEVMLRLVAPDERHSFREVTPQGTRLLPRWFGTLGARLALEGRAVDPSTRTASDSLDFLRLVHVSPQPYGLPIELAWLPSGVPPCGWIWERVPGAVVQARGTPGESLRVTLELAYPGRERRLVWTRAEVCGDDGLARVRVPYATDALNGDGEAAGPARWSLGTSSGTLGIPEGSVLTGGTIDLPGR
jgi:asparagine N-glycosylation enzyme membrane subunit Stt3